MSVQRRVHCVTLESFEKFQHHYMTAVASQVQRRTQNQELIHADVVEIKNSENCKHMNYDFNTSD